MTVKFKAGGADFALREINDAMAIIEDLDCGGASVKNAVVSVVAAVDEYVGGLGRRRLIYRDSMQLFAEIVHSCGRFIRFEPSSPAQQHFYEQLVGGGHRDVE